MGARLRFMALCGALLLVAAACDWSSVGFDAARGGFSAFDRHLTPENVSGLSERWAANAGNKASAPVVGGGRVFVTTQPTSATPGGLAAYDAAGVGCTSAAPAVCSPVWSKPLGSAIGNPSISPPLLTDGYVSADGTVETSTLVPIPRHAPVYTYAVDHVGGAFDPATGSPVSGEMRDGAAPAAASDGSVFGYVHTVYLIRQGLIDLPTTYFVASVPADKGVNFAIRGDFTSPDFVGSAPAVSDGSLFILRPGQLQAYDAHGRQSCAPSTSFIVNACSPIWTGTLAHVGAFDGMPAFAKGKVYVPEVNGAVEVFDAAGCGASTCAPAWTAHAGSVHIAPVAVTDTTLFVSSDDGHLYAFTAGGCGTATCEPVWTANLPSGPHAPSIAGSLLFVGTNDGTLAAFDATGCGSSTCTPIWSDNVGAPITTAPAIADGRVFVTDTNGTLHTFGL